MSASVYAPERWLRGALDALLDTRKSVERLRSLLPNADARLLEDTGHAIIARFEEVRDYLLVNLTSK